MYSLNCLVLSLRCAELAKRKGYRYFGLQFYGECWSGVHSSALFNARKSEKCWGYRPDYENCVDDSPTECIGQEHHNYIYEVRPEGKFDYNDFDLEHMSNTQAHQNYGKKVDW